MRKIALLILCVTVLTQMGVNAIADNRVTDEQRVLTNLKSTQYDVRMKAIVSVRSKQGKIVVDELLRIAKDDDNSYVRSQAVHALGFSDDPRIVPLLLEQIKGSSSNIAEAACHALGRTGDARAYGTLVPVLRGSNQALAPHAALGLGHLGEQRAFAAIKEQFEKRDSGSRHYAEALACLNKSKALEYLCKTLAAGPRPELCNAIAIVLKKHPSKSVRDSMAESLKTKGFERLHAVEVLGAVGDKSSVDPLCRFYKRTKYAAALEALGQIGDSSATPLLLDALKTGHRGTAAKALGLIGGDKSVAYAVADSLTEKRTPNPKRHPELKLHGDLFTGVDIFEKLNMLVALGRLAEPSTIATLIPYLDDRDESKQDPRLGMWHPYPMNTPTCKAALWAINRILAGKDSKVEWNSRHDGAPLVNRMPKSAKLKNIVTAKKWWEKAKDDPKYSRQKVK